MPLDVSTISSLNLPPAFEHRLTQSSHRSQPMRILAMNIDACSRLDASPPKPATTVTISPWVNEPLPDIRGILCSRDLARLTRRPRWVLCGLALMGKFPRKKRYQGRLVGWCRTEVLEWMSRELSLAPIRATRPDEPRRCARRHSRQVCL